MCYVTVCDVVWNNCICELADLFPHHTIYCTVLHYVLLYDYSIINFPILLLTVMYPPTYQFKFNNCTSVLPKKDTAIATTVQRARQPDSRHTTKRKGRPIVVVVVGVVSSFTVKYKNLPGWYFCTISNIKYPGYMRPTLHYTNILHTTLLAIQYLQFM